MELFTLKNLGFTYANANAPSLSAVNLSVREGEFITLCGKSGSGKSTLLRQLKPSLTPFGKTTGEVFYRGRPAKSLDLRTDAQEIGFVLQNTDSALVTDKVWHELSFGLESLGLESAVIRRRVAEMASFFGIQTWFYRSLNELSGGQRQLLSLASVMTMQPRVLI